MSHFQRLHQLLLSWDSVFNRQQNTCLFISSPEITIVTVVWIRILHIFPKSVFWKKTLFKQAVCEAFSQVTFQAEPHHPSPVRHKQTTATLYQEKKGGKKGKSSWMWKAGGGGGNNLTGHLIFTVFFAAQALSCLLKGGTLNSCSRFLLAYFFFSCL